MRKSPLNVIFVFENALTKLNTSANKVTSEGQDMSSILIKKSEYIYKK